MKYCTKCGAELFDEAVICPKCGCATESKPTVAESDPQDASTMRIVAKIFMIISCVVTALWLIPLCWTIPMTVVYSKKIHSHQHVGTGFKVCCLLFVNTISGILMLCDHAPD